MPLFGKKNKDKNKSSNEDAKADELALENDDDDDDNLSLNDEQAEADLLDGAVSQLDDDDDDDDDDDEENENEEDEDDDKEEEELDPDLLDIFTNEEVSDIDLGALTKGLEDVTAASLLTLAQEVVDSLRKQAAAAS